MSENSIPTLQIGVRATPQGFDAVQAAIKAMDETAKTVARAMAESFKTLPAQIASAVASAVGQERDSVQNGARAVEAIRRELADREAQITKSAVDYRVHLIQQEGEQIKAAIQKHVTDRQQAEAMIEQNARQVEARITQVQQQEAERREAIAKQEAEAAKRASDERQRALGQVSGVAFAALSAGTLGALKAFSDFEGVMNGIAAVSDTTAQQMEALRAKAMQLGADTKFSATEAAQGMFELSKAGFTAEETAKAIDGVLATAAAAGTTVAQAAEITGGTLRGFSLEAKEAGRVADLLAQSANKSSVDVKDLGESMKYIAPVASSANQSLESVVTMLSVMGNQMIKGSEAGTSLRHAILSLEAPPKAAAEELHKLHISVQDTSGKMLPFMDIINQLREATAKYTDVQRSAALEHIFGREALSGVLALVNTAPESFNAMSDAMNNAGGAAKEMADKMNAGIGAQFKQLTSSLETLGITLGDEIAPALKSVIVVLKDVTNDFAALPEPVKAVIAGLVAASVAFTGVLTAVAALGIAIPILTLAVGALGLELAPIIGIAALVAAGVAVLTYESKREADALAAHTAELEKNTQGRLAAGQQAQQQALEIAELVRKHDELIDRTHRTTEEQKQLDQINETLKKKYPELADAVAASGNSHLANARAVVQEIEKKRQLQLENYKTLQSEVALQRMQFVKAGQALANAQTNAANAEGDSSASIGIGRGGGVGVTAMARVTQAHREMTTKMAEFERSGQDLAKAQQALDAFSKMMQQGPAAPASLGVARGAEVADPAKHHAAHAKAHHEKTQNVVSDLMLEAKAHGETTADKIKDLQEELKQKGLTAKQRLQIEAQIAALQKQLAREVAQEQTKAAQLQMKAIEDVFRTAEQDTLVGKGEALRQKLASLQGLSKKPMPAEEAANVKSAISETQRAINANNAAIKKGVEELNSDIYEAEVRATGETLAYKLVKNAEYWQERRNKAKSLGQEETAINQAQADAEARIKEEFAQKAAEKQHELNLKLLSQVEAIVADGQRLWNDFTDSGTLAFDRIKDAGALFYDTFKSQIADAVGNTIREVLLPALVDVWMSISTGGIPALWELFSGWVAAGAAAVVTGAQMAAAWLASLGPLGWLIAGVAAVTAGILAVTAAMGLWNQAVAETPEQTKSRLESELEAARVYHDHMTEMAVSRQMEENDLIVKLTKERNDGLIKTDEDFQNRLMIGRLAIQQKYDEEAAKVDRAHRDATLQRMIDEATIAGDKQMELTLQQAGEENRAVSELQKAYQDGAFANDTEYLTALNTRLAAINKGFLDQKLKAAQDEEKQEIDKHFSAEQQKLDDTRKGLEKKLEAEEAGAKATLQRLQDQNEKYQEQIDLLDKAIRKVKEKYDVEREQLAKTAKDDFAAKLAKTTLGPDTGITKDADLQGMGRATGTRITLGADDLTFQGIKLQEEAVNNQFILEKITAQQKAQMLSDLALKRAKLAQQELQTDGLIYSEKVKAEKEFADAYADYKKQQLDLIQAKQDAESKVAEQQRARLEQQKTDNEGLIKNVQHTIAEIQKPYTKWFKDLDDSIAKNKSNWDQALKDIAKSTDSQVRSIAAKWQPLIDKLQKAVNLASELGGGPVATPAPAPARPTNTGGYDYYNPFEMAATGGLVRGGKRGLDSVPILAQDGELIVDNSLTARLDMFLSSMDGALNSANNARFAMAGGGYVDNSVSIVIRDPVVRQDADIDRLAQAVSRQIARRI